MSKHKHESLKSKGERGDYSDVIDPLDYLIMAELPSPGTTFGGLYPMGNNMEYVANRLHQQFKEVDLKLVIARMRTLLSLGLVHQVATISVRNRAYQRTENGEGVYSAWKSGQQKQ